MKGANARREKPKSRLARLNDQIVRANQFVGRHAYLTWLGACWLFPYVRWSYLAIVHIGTVLGIAYLVYDSLYQTAVSVSVVYSDAATALENPIAVQNKSNLFAIRNIQWACQTSHVEYSSGLQFENVILGVTGHFSAIAPGKVLNIRCNQSTSGRNKIVDVQGAKLAAAELVLVIDYDADFFGLWSMHRTSTTPFTWVNNIASPQWVQGEFAKGQ